MVDRIDHGTEMFQTLQSLPGRQVFFIKGDMEVEERRRIQELMEKDDNVICVAMTKIFSTGISIKNLHYIIFTTGGKSKVRVLQSIGRGLRTNENKERLIIVDIVDELIYGKKQYKKRKQLYAGENLQITDKSIKETTT